MKTLAKYDMEGNVMRKWNSVTPTKQQLAKWKSNRKKWVKALRSKKYIQGEGELLNEHGHYCCLGVLSVIIGMKPITRSNRLTYFGKDYQIAPPSACMAVGLMDQHGTYDDTNNSANCLTNDNDDGKTFEQIADIIESEPCGLFRDTS